MLEGFARAHRLRNRPDHKEELQKTLDDCFSLAGAGLAWSFGQLSSPVEGKSVRLFRAVELLDLNQHAQAYSTHYPRIAALFDISIEYEKFFVLDKSMRYCIAEKIRGNLAGEIS